MVKEGETCIAYNHTWAVEHTKYHFDEAHKRLIQQHQPKPIARSHGFFSL